MIESRKFYGKYRGRVVNNLDPQRRGRVQALVPDALGITPSTWALPALLSVGTQSGTFIVPPIGAGVWIEFEQGEIDYPIWSGCFWDCQADVPAEAQAAPPGVANIIFQTEGQHSLRICDLPQVGIRLRSPGGASITVNDAGGIVIADGQGGTIVIAKGIVSINGTALVVTK